jgi:glucosylceramidase
MRSQDVNGSAKSGRSVEVCVAAVAFAFHWFVCASHTMAGTWHWVASTDAKRWVDQPVVVSTTVPAAEVRRASTAPATEPGEAADQPAPTTMPPTITIDPSATAQRIDGWGGCFNEIGWRAVLRLDDASRDRVLRALFDAREGLGFNLGRVPIGASDFALSAYSLDDVPGDLSLAHFSIDRDRWMLIPYIRAALAIRPDLKLWASPWSPPAWMKTNGLYHGGSMRQDPAVLKAYATYLARFVEAYRDDGLNIAEVHVQNEPSQGTKYPSCPWDAAALRDFIRDYAGPTFAARRVPAQLWLGTITTDHADYLRTVLDDPKAAGYVAGAGLQYSSRHIAGQLHAAYPSLPLMQTETKCFSGQNSWKDAEETFRLMQMFIRGGVNAYMYWNMVLDQTGLSSWGWSQDATITVNTVDGTVTYTPQYFLMRHLTAFVKPGATFLKPSADGDPVLAFRAADGSVVAVVANMTAADHAVELRLGGEAATVVIRSHSFNTFVDR